ncbi:ectoine/hydroxyectoine ABC transporter substrate-binding protein EhuB [Mangrovicoccus sp. HB161399]|uniref:ectoine/hydroxyectoine ABC transporter substrate-binding protein EhuB n=1 Tax=Mangrovicoccus sp. HB161399 TaxID=2720392 RepID=UPI0015537E89|nr:ectoine/hydroxyectoine ABC transporter substrate-binding protein EhuB [Mangrovicoccus sp. HB161399]
MRGTLATAGAVCALALSQLATAAAAQETLLGKYREAGVRVGIAGYAPYGYKQADGSFTGEQVEVVQHVLTEMGITDIEYIAMDFGALIPSLVAGRIDMSAAGMYIRPERCEQVLFAEPTFGQGAAYVVKAGNPKNLHSFTDIAETDGAILAVLAGGTEEDLALKDGVPEDKLLKVSDKAAGISAVLSGRADGFALSAFAIADIVRTAGELIGVESSGSITEIAGEVYKGHGAISFPKGTGDDMAANLEFRDSFNAIQTAYIESGGYAEMASAWGFTPADGPAYDMATLCGSGL